MGLFDLFRKRGVRRDPDRVWVNASARLEGLWTEARSSSANGAVLVLAHFAARLEELRAAAGAPPHERLPSASAVAGFLASRTPGRLAIAQAAALAPAPSRSGHRHERPVLVLVAERHPLRARDERLETALASFSGPDVLRFHLALDDPLIRRFAGDALAPLLEQLGLTESEPIESPMIDRAVAGAQRQVAGRARADVDAASSEGWLATNLPP